jgi:hypothetical protein
MPEFFPLFCETGNSQIEFTVFASMHSFPKSFDDSDTQQDLSKLKIKYEKLLSEVGNLQALKVKIDVFTVSKGLIEEPSVELSGEDLYLHQGQVRHHFAAVLVTFSKMS